MVEIINLTPHDINIYNEEGELIKIFKRSGTVARVQTFREKIGEIEGIPVYKIIYGYPENIPEYRENTYIIVSLLVAQTLILLNSKWIGHILVPDTSPQSAIRDKDGKIIGVKALQIW